MANKASLVIVGGGLHGVHLAAVALRRGWVTTEELVIVDPHPRLLHQFFTRAARVGMSSMRSPAVHHVDVAYDALWAYGQRRGLTLADFAAPYALPSLQVFEAHAQDVVRSLGLAGCHLRADALRAVPAPRGWHLSTTAGDLEADRVVLALGQSPAPAPSWAEALFKAGRAASVLDAGAEDLSPPPAGDQPPRRMAVVGGGITAVQHALSLCARHEVTLVMRREPDVQRFDADPEWMGPRGEARFQRSSLQERQHLLIAERHGGSIPPELRKALASARREGRLQVLLGEVATASLLNGHPATGAVLCLNSGERVVADEVRLAIGLQPGPPAGAFMDALDALAADLARHAPSVGDARVRTGIDDDAAAKTGAMQVEQTSLRPLTRGPGGSPRIDRFLRWAPGLYVMGRLAELEVGPTAGNLAGARLAAERIEQGFVAEGAPRPAAPRVFAASAASRGADDRSDLAIPPMLAPLPCAA